MIRSSNCSGVLQVGLRQHGELALLALDAAGRDLDVLAAQRRPRRPAGVRLKAASRSGSSQMRMEYRRSPNMRTSATPGMRLEPVLDVAVGIVGDLERGVPVAVKGEIHDRLGVGLELLDDRLVDLVRQAPRARAPTRSRTSAAASSGSRSSWKRTVIWLDLLAADRGDVVDALDAGERVFQHLGDLGLDDRGAGAGIGRLDGDHRRVDVRVFAHAQAVVGDEADEHEHEAQHRGEDRALDR